MWLYKDKGGVGVRLNNGHDGGGEYVFHKDGGFRAPSSVYAGAARMGADGNIHGSKWGGYLSEWLSDQVSHRGAKNTALLATNGWWKCGDSGLIRQWGITPPLYAGQVYTVTLPCPVPHEILSATATVKYKGIASEGNLGTYVEIEGKSLIISADYTRTAIQAPRTWELFCC